MIALGGGVIGDTCGFAAAIYQRGIRFIQVITSMNIVIEKLLLHSS